MRIFNFWGKDFRKLTNRDIPSYSKVLKISLKKSILLITETTLSLHKKSPIFALN